MREIGSEFWTTESQDVKFFLVGRAALEFIVRDIIQRNHIESVLLPSLCCHTMIEPFARHGINIRFYDVCVDNYGLKAMLPLPRKEEILLVLSYFGYSPIRGLNDIRRWNYVIEDCTHSWLSNWSISGTDYCFTSYRKWSGFAGIAIAKKVNGKFEVNVESLENRYYWEHRNKAKRIKKEFIDNGLGKKDEYLSLFSAAEEIIDTDYINYVPAMEDIQNLFALDIQSIKEKRRRNAKLIIDGLKDIKELRLIWNDLKDEDVPLNVPILIDKGHRDELRKYLVEKQIYCPIHWPLSELHEGISEQAKEIYYQELSLICDQRYNAAEITREINAIREFFLKSSS